MRTITRLLEKLDLAAQFAQERRHEFGNLVQPMFFARGRLAFDKLPVQMRISQLNHRGLALIAGYLAISLVLAGVAGTVLSRSIRRLRDAARRVAGGQTDQPLQIETSITEVSSLAQDLELMRGELVRQGRELHALAYFDGLTGLANRVLFSERLAQARSWFEGGEDRHGHDRDIPDVIPELNEARRALKSALGAAVLKAIVRLKRP